MARGFTSHLATPAFLVDDTGHVIFFNEAAGELLGVHFEEAGANSPLQSPSVPYGCANPAIPRRGKARWGVLS